MRHLPRLLPTAAKICITLFLLVVLFRNIDFAATLRSMRAIKPVTVGLGVVLLVSATGLAAMRWQIVLRSMDRNFSQSSLFRLSLIGQFFNQVLPSAIGGDGMRVFLLYRRGCPLVESFNSVLIDRIAGFFSLGLMSLYGLPTIAVRLFGIPETWTVVTIVMAAVVGTAALYALSVSRVWLQRFRVGRFVAQIVDDALFLAVRFWDATIIGVLSVISQALSFVLIWFVLRDLGAPVSLLGVMIVSPVVLLLLVLPVSIAGWGLREGLFVIGFGILNVPKDTALAASIIFGLLNLAVGLAGGLLWVLESAHAHDALTPQAAAEATSPQQPAPPRQRG